MIIGICVIILALSFVFKKHARTILWSSAITLFAGTLLLIGIGVINPVGEDKTGSVEFWGAIITLISGAALAFCAEKLKEIVMCVVNQHITYPYIKNSSTNSNVVDY